MITNTEVDGIKINQMAAKLSDHIWTVEEFMTFPSIPQKDLYEQLFEIYVEDCLSAEVLDDVS